MIVDMGEGYLSEGWYIKPHYLLRLAEWKQLTKSEFILLDILFHFSNWFTTKQPNGWFFCDDGKVCKTRLISAKTLIGARRSLKAKGIIDIKKGYSHHSTEYRILLEEFWR